MSGGRLSLSAGTAELASRTTGAGSCENVCDQVRGSKSGEEGSEAGENESERAAQVLECGHEMILEGPGDANNPVSGAKYHVRDCPSPSRHYRVQHHQIGRAHV